MERLLTGRKSPSIRDLLQTGLNGCLSDVLNPFNRLGDVMRMAKKADIKLIDWIQKKFRLSTPNEKYSTT